MARIVLFSTSKVMWPGPLALIIVPGYRDTFRVQSFQDSRFEHLISKEVNELMERKISVLASATACPGRNVSPEFEGLAFGKYGESLGKQLDFVEIIRHDSSVMPAPS